MILSIIKIKSVDRKIFSSFFKLLKAIIIYEFDIITKCYNQIDKFKCE